MEEGGVAAHGDHLLVQAVVGQLAQALGHVDAGAHAVAGLPGVLPGGLACHEVAADVAHHHAGVLFLAHGPLEKVERRPVWAARAEAHLPDGELQVSGGLFLRQGRAGEAADGGGNHVRVQLTHGGQGAAPAQEPDLHALPARQGLDRPLQEGVHFLQDQDLLCGAEVI